MSDETNNWKWEHDDQSDQSMPEPKYGRIATPEEKENILKKIKNSSDIDSTSLSDTKADSVLDTSNIIPMRPQNISTIIDGTFKAIQKNPKVFLGISSIIAILLIIIEFPINYFLFNSINSLQNFLENINTNNAVVPEILEYFRNYIISTSILSIISGIFTLIITGISSLAVADLVIKRKYSLKYYINKSKEFLLKLILLLIVYSLLITIIGMLLLSISVVIPALLFFTLPAELYYIAIIVAVILFIITVILMLFMIIRLSFSTQVLVLENEKILSSIKRSWKLSKGYFWVILGRIVLIAILMSAIFGIISLGANLVLSLFLHFDTLLLISNAISTLLNIIFVTPIFAISTTLIYIDLRIRKEGLDIELQKAIEESE